MRTYLLVLFAPLLAGCAATPQAVRDRGGTDTIALELFERSARSWNRGDLRARYAPRFALVLVRGVILRDHSS